jgi:hypothetical protein
VPIAAIGKPYSITSSARASSRNVTLVTLWKAALAHTTDPIKLRKSKSVPTKFCSWRKLEEEKKMGQLFLA